MYRYAHKVEDESIVAKGLGRTLPISWKQGVEISNAIRGKSFEKAVSFLENVIAMKVPVPFKRFNGDVGHRKGNMAAGRYPQKACKQILGVLKSAESNAKDKGLIIESLYIAHICVHKAGKQMHYGRKGSREMKRANVEVILKENMDIKKEIEKKLVKKPAKKNVKLDDKKVTSETENKGKVKATKEKKEITEAKVAKKSGEVTKKKVEKEDGKSEKEDGKSEKDNIKVNDKKTEEVNKNHKAEQKVQEIAKKETQEVDKEAEETNVKKEENKVESEKEKKAAEIKNNNVNNTNAQSQKLKQSPKKVKSDSKTQVKEEQ